MDEKFKKEYQERLFTKQKEFLAVEEKWKDEIDAYIAKKEEESRVRESMEESKAKEAEENAQKSAKRESFLSALTGLQSLEYRDGDTEALINEAIERLQELNGTDDYYNLSQQLEAAIRRVRALPKKEEETTESKSGDGSPFYSGPGPGNFLGERDSNNGPGVSP